MTGIVIVDKPEGWTSQDVTAKLRSVYHERRVGHGGTLDPMATGVLPVFLGRATRAVPFFESAVKEYVAELLFGTVTDTQDVTGNILRVSSMRPNESDFLSALRASEGTQLQLPPMYSAIKVNGKKLYELARSGVEIERTPREITLFELECLSFSGDTARFRVRCSKGTYVRTVCHDLGEKLGCGACMKSLRRTKAGCFEEQQAFTMEELLAGRAKLLPVDSLFSALPELRLDERQRERCYHGNPIPGITGKQGDYRVYGPDGEFLMVANLKNGELKTVKSFFEV